MTTKENRKYEMLVRVRQFGEAHRDVFPSSTAGGQAFDAVSAAITAIGTHAVSKRTTAGEGRVKKHAVREAMLAHLEAVSRCARVIARDQPGFAEPFRLGRLRSNRTIVTTARAFVQEAAKSERQFVALGMSGTFVSELIGLVDAFEQAIDTCEAGKNEHVAARASINSGLADALALLPRLDVMVANQFRSDPATLAVWERDRRFDVPRRVRRRAKPAPSVTDAASTTAVGSHA